MPHARTTDPITSHQAAASVTKITETQSVIIWLFEKHMYLTDEQLYAYYTETMALGGAPMASSSGIRTRRSELTQLGYLEDSGRRAKTISNRNAIIWQRVLEDGLFK